MPELGLAPRRGKATTDELLDLWSTQSSGRRRTHLGGGGGEEPAGGGGEEPTKGKRWRGEERQWGPPLTCGATATSSKTSINTSEGSKMNGIDS
jgi:hypothetical protein